MTDAGRRQPRMTEFFQGQQQLMLQAVSVTLAVDTIRARFDRTVELLAEDPPMRAFAQEFGVGGVELASALGAC